MWSEVFDRRGVGGSNPAQFSSFTVSIEKTLDPKTASSGICSALNCSSHPYVCKWVNGLCEALWGTVTVRERHHIEVQFIHYFSIW